MRISEINPLKPLKQRLVRRLYLLFAYVLMQRALTIKLVNFLFSNLYINENVREIEVIVYLKAF